MNAEANVQAVIAEQSLSRGWEAGLKLGFVQKGSKTLLSQREHQGPLTVQRPFYPEGGLCHVYLIHPPGGVVSGDSLALNVHVDCRAEALITTPGAGKIYRSAGKQAVQSTSISISERAGFEWLPQETILYEGAKFASETRIKLAENARFIGWEIIALGRPAAGESFNRGEATLKWKIERYGTPLFQEKIILDANAFAARWGLNGHSVCGTLFACSAEPEHLEKIRDLIAESPGLGVTLIDDLLICRACLDKAWEVRHFFEQVRCAIRQDILQRKAIAPRIWAT